MIKISGDVLLLFFMAVLPDLSQKITVQDVQNNRPQTRALHALPLHSQLLSEANGRSAHSEIKIHPIANKFA